MTHSLYNIGTGELTGLSMLADAALLALNTPPGHAWVAGQHDAQRRRVQLITDDFGNALATVVPRVPPQPAASAYQTWAWDAEAEAWRPEPTLLLLKEQARAPILAELAVLDSRQARPVAEIAEAAALGNTPPVAAVQRLQSINADKQALRQRLAAIAAAADAGQLAAVIE